MDNLDTKEVWKDVLNVVKISVSGANFSTWFTQTHLVSWKPAGDGRGVAEIGCSSSFVKTTIEGRYYTLLQDAMNKTLGSHCDLLFIIKQLPETETVEKPIPLFQKEKPVDEEDFRTALEHSRIRKNYTFETFAVSSSNQMAWAAADAVSQNPGSSYNPLFIWGGVGVGKTHLMNAVGYSVVKKDPDANATFCTGEEFTNDIVEGIRNKTTQAFRNKYRKLKVLMIDDIQFIAGKDAVQEEFFHTFNSLVSNGSQIILTSDKPPSDISKLEERLRSRFEAGLIVDIAPPDFELRCAILQIKAKQRNIDIPTHMVHLIAGNIDTPRKIEGFVTRLYSEIFLKKQDLTDEMVESLIGKGEDSNNGNRSKAQPDDLIEAVSKFYSIGKRKLLGETRVKNIAEPRQVLMYLLRTQLSLPLEEVGRLIGGRDHTTVMHAVDKITHMASMNVQIREDIMGIKNMI